MNFELLRNEFIKLKKEELEYIDSVGKISSEKKLSEFEKLEVYRTLNNYEVELKKVSEKLYKEFRKDKKITRENKYDVIVEFDVDKDFLSSVNFTCKQIKEYVLEDLCIDLETYKFKLTLFNLIYNQERSEFFSDVISNNQKLIENPIYIFFGYYDYSSECYGPCFGEFDDYVYAIYINIRSKNDSREEILKNKVEEFEKDKIIIPAKKYVKTMEISKIFKEELLNIKNNTLDDCVIQTKKRVEELSYIRSPEYKEKVLLDRIGDLYEKVKGEFIEKEILYSGNFLEILSESYKLPNEKIVKKEKIVKNGGKDSVIVVAITQDKEYIITFQNRIKDEIVAEFPAGYIECGEDLIEAAKRELKEETGYVTDDVFVVDEVYSALGIDNSITYIVVANNCIKTADKSVNGTELVNYGLFLENELEYLVNKNIMKGAINKLAYYNLLNNVEDCNITYVESNKKVYKKLREKIK